MNIDHFFEISCLVEQSKTLNAVDLAKRWTNMPDKRKLSQYLIDFQSINQSSLSFIGVIPNIIKQDNDPSLNFTSSNYIGAVPMFSPTNGKQIGDFIVSPRYIEKGGFNEFSEIIDLLGNSITIEFLNTGTFLNSGHRFDPPLYLEVLKFINALEELVKSNWVKFSVINKDSKIPVGSINWNKYSKDSYKVEQRLIFPVKKSIVSTEHTDYMQIKYVFNLCKSELLSNRTPENIKRLYKNKIDILDVKLYQIKPLKVSFFPDRHFEASSVKLCKSIANNILNYNLRDSLGWRIDVAVLFERYVQYLFQQLKNDIGGNLSCNDRFFQIKKRKFDWALKYLEPDIVFNFNNKSYFIDAKYKVNLYNFNSNSELLKELHRHDLHQIIAYSAFSNLVNKHTIICYPSTNPSIDELKYYNSTNAVSVSVYILGIPMKRSLIPNTLKLIKNHFINN